jgi:hypothetical protein
MAFIVPFIPYIVAALAAAGAAVDISGNNAQKGAEIDAEKYNRDLLRRQAGNEALRSSLAEDAQRREAAFSLARTRGGLLQAGIGNAQGGSAVAVSGQASKFAELDALNIRWEGDRQRTVLLAQSDITQVGIEGLRSQRKTNKVQSLLQGASSAIGAFGGGGGAGGAGGILSKIGGGGAPTGTAKATPAYRVPGSTRAGSAQPRLG